MFKAKILAVFFAALIFFGGAAIAEDKKEQSSKGLDGIVVVDIQQLEATSDAAKKLKEKLKKEREKFQKEIVAQEKKLRDEQKKILESKEKLEPEEFKKKAMAFEKELIESQKDIQKKKLDFDKRVGEALGKLRTEVVRVVGNLATENNYKLVLTRQNVVIVEKESDITSLALKEMNKSVKDIPLK